MDNGAEDSVVNERGIGCVLLARRCLFATVVRDVCPLSQYGHCGRLQYLHNANLADIGGSIMGKTLHNTIRLGRRTIFDIAIDEASALLRKVRALRLALRK
jgi:hypothetical protein